MKLFNQTSKLLLRHSNKFNKRYVLFSGDLQDKLPITLDTKLTRIHTQYYHHWQTLNTSLKENAYFALIADRNMVAGCNTLIFFWQKNKLETQFQLQNLLSSLPIGSDVFIIGNNCSGVRSAEKMLNKWISINKIDSAYHSCLYYGQLKKQAIFITDNFWYEYQIGNIRVKTLPGVFSRHALDNGSKMLLSTFKKNIEGSVLDIGCGAGVLSMILASFSPNIDLTLTDVNAAAIETSKVNLAINHLKGDVIVSNIYSNIYGNFDTIISNPPFHDGIEKSLKTSKHLIHGAINHLTIGGELRIVANAFLPYPRMLNETFGSYEILLKNNRFIVYRAIKKNYRKSKVI